MYRWSGSGLVATGDVGTVWMVVDPSKISAPMRSLPSILNHVSSQPTWGQKDPRTGALGCKWTVTLSTLYRSRSVCSLPSLTSSSNTKVTGKWWSSLMVKLGLLVVGAVRTAVMNDGDVCVHEYVR